MHHNVCYDTRGDELRLNKPSTYNQVFNNTLIGNLGQWGRWPEDNMFADRIANNLLAGRINRHPEMILAANVENVPEDVLNPDTFRDPGALPGRDGGIPIPGIVRASTST